MSNQPVDEEDFWTVDGERNFGIMPAGLTPITADSVPILLHRGDAAWGETHIRCGHQPWLNKLKMTAPQLVWMKCQQSGQLFDPQDSRHKFTIALTVAPTALLVLRFVQKDGIFTVVTLYNRNRPPGGILIGRYVGQKSPNQSPKFALQPKAKAQIIIKQKSRTLE